MSMGELYGHWFGVQEAYCDSIGSTEGSSATGRERERCGDLAREVVRGPKRLSGLGGLGMISQHGSPPSAFQSLDYAQGDVSRRIRYKKKKKKKNC